MPSELILVGAVVFFALFFNFTNGFHDTANAIATSVSTRVLTPRQAILMAAILNFVGSFWGEKVAKTIGKGIVEPHLVTQQVVLAALIGAIVWNLITWYFGIPSSSSHALIGGLVGAVIAKSGFAKLDWTGFVEKIILPLITSPIIGLVIGFAIMVLIMWIFRRVSPARVNILFSKLQILSAGFMAFSHGSNDATKAMGIITLSLFSAGIIKDFSVPQWVLITCAIVMALGTSMGGWKIIKTMGHKIIKLQPVHGFAAEAAATVTILVATFLGRPVSTTHVISGSIMGVGASKRLSAVKWGVAGNIVTAWVLTPPVCAVLAGVTYLLLNAIV